VLENGELRISMHRLVWDLIIDPPTFEERWMALMNKYGLADHRWLREMYDIRHQWIPCYFRDIPMCCLMKTTSRCESSNALFKVNSNISNTLLQFMMCFDTAIDGQRYNQRLLEFETMTTVPGLSTDLPIEKHAAEYYTTTVFKEVRKEIIRGLLHCSIGPTTTDGDQKVYIVSHCNKKYVELNKFEVLF
jgi:hypothetical protein